MAESTPSPKKRGEVDTSKPYADVKEAILRFDLPGVEKSSAERGFESPIGALKEQLAEAMAAKDKIESDKLEITQELDKLKSSYEQVSRRLEDALSTPTMASEERDNLQKLYESATLDLGASKRRIQTLEAEIAGASDEVADPGLEESLRRELDDAREGERRSKMAAESLAREVESLKTKVAKLGEELLIARAEVERWRRSEAAAMASLGASAAETKRLEAEVKAAEDEKVALQATTRYLEPELESARAELAALASGNREQGSSDEAGKIEARMESARIAQGKIAASVAGMMEGLEMVSAEAIEAAVVRDGVAEEASRMKREAEELKRESKASEELAEFLERETMSAKGGEAAALAAIKELDRDHHEESAIEEETRRKLAEARREEEGTRKREGELKRRLEEARAEIEASRMDLKLANDKAAIAEAAKSAVEGELRRWRSENEQRRKMAMVANLTAATPIPQRNGEAVAAAIVPENGRRSSTSSVVDSGAAAAAAARIEEGRRSSSESLAQMLHMRLPADASGRSKPIVVDNTEIKKKKLKLLARLGAVFSARKKR